MKVNQNKVIELIDHLRGSCMSMEQAVIDVFGEDVDWMDFPEEVITDIDEAVLLCDTCGWWYDAGEISDDDGNLICFNCNNEEHEEEE